MAYIGEKNQGGFNNKITTQRTPIIELNAVANLSKLRDDTQEEGNGVVKDNGSEYIVRHQGAGDLARLASAERGRYIPGNTSDVGVGVRFDSTPTDGDIECIWGYFHMEIDSNGDPTTNIKDGYIVGVDTTDIFFEVIKSGTSLHKEYKNNWNIDPNINIDLTDGNIFQINYTYYGYGLIKLQIVDSDDGEQQKLKDLHSVRIRGETSLNNSNLKVGGMIKSTNSTDDITMFVAGRQYATNGPYTPNIRITTENRLQQTVGTGEEYTPIMTFKRKFDERQTPIELYGMEILSNQDLLVDVHIDTSLTGETFEEISNQLSGETSVEVDTSATNVDLSQGVKVYETLINGGDQANRSDITTQDNLPLSIPDQSTVTLSARAISTEATVSTVFKVKEEF